MNIIDQLKWRYATKKFNPNKTLTAHKLNTLKEAFNLTATSFGLQTITLVVIENKDLRKTLVPHSYHQKQVLEASHLLVICIQDDILESDIFKYYENIKHARGTSEAVLKPYRQDLISMMKKIKK